jgi:hypothetical protein
MKTQINKRLISLFQRCVNSFEALSRSMKMNRLTFLAAQLAEPLFQFIQQAFSPSMDDHSIRSTSLFRTILNTPFHTLPFSEFTHVHPVAASSVITPASTPVSAFVIKNPKTVLVFADSNPIRIMMDE